MVDWEYVTINYAQEGSLTQFGTMIWVAAIKWPSADRLDVRNEVSIDDLLNELGRQGWELVSESPAPGINARNFRLKRPRTATL